ncbi:hypothetical protein AAFN69_29700 [Streptomyces sp. CAU 1734]
MTLTLLLSLLGISLVTAPPSGARPAAAAAPAGWTVVDGSDGSVAGFHTIRSAANNRYVTAEQNWNGDQYGWVRARSTTADLWEQFDLVWDASTASFAIRSRLSLLYAAAELRWPDMYYGVIRARSATVDAWERFTLLYNPGSGRYALQSQANGLYLAAELNGYAGWYGVLQARSSTIDTWEEFLLA